VRVEDALADITALIRKNRLVEGLVHEQAAHAADSEKAGLVESLVTKQNRAALQSRLDRLHPADIAYILEALPLDERLYVWDLIKSAERDGEILLEVRDAVRESLISSMDTEELVAAPETLEADEIAATRRGPPAGGHGRRLPSAPVEEREQLRAAMSFEEDMVGALMDFEDIQVRPDVTLDVVLRYLRRFDELPSQTDQLFVVDRDERLLGVLPSQAARQRPRRARRRRDGAAGRQAAAAREGERRGERVRALRPRLGAGRRHQRPLVGRVTVDEILDFVRAARRGGMLAQAGLREEEDVFASVWKSFQNRWTWLAINLVTAFIRVARDRRVRGLDREAGRARRADADRRGHRRQLGQPDDHDDRARGRARAGHARARREADPQGAAGRAAERPRVGRRDGAGRDDALPATSLGLVMVLAMTLNLLLAALMGVLIPMTMLQLAATRPSARRC
jgi:magnesium transporter